MLCAPIPSEAQKISCLSQVLKHFLHEGYRGIIISRWILVRGGHIHSFHKPVVDKQREPLAARIAKNGHGPGMVQNHTKSIRQFAAWVTEECDYRAFHTLILCPCCHDSAIIDAENNYVRDTLGLQLILFLQVPRHLCCGSGGSEGTWETYEHNLLAFAKFAE